MIIPNKPILDTIAVFFFLTCCKSPSERWAEEYAANEEVAEYMRNFEGRGAVTDPTSMPKSPSESLSLFQLSDDLEISLVMAEPEVMQPVEMNFDHKGRLWVVQYNQYPYPKGLKVTSIDNHTRVTFDKTPVPPPTGVQGADKITFFEDLDGDGIYERSVDAITGLNIATSVNVGRGRIWVLTPPYLISYPDTDDNGIPDGEPSVHLKGFGLEDTHAVANSLTWGPDGWLYGVQGSTTTAHITSKQTGPVSFLGQAVWRFHPETESFELFAEGGGNNPFNLEFDSEGRAFSGSNGSDRGPYYKQGGYYVKSWGKHGPLTNPYTFGHLPNMSFEGERIRFTHAFVRYEADLLPEPYRGKLIALNPLHNYIQITRLEPVGSSMAAIDEDIMLKTSDRWFRPIDIKVGPDGAVYFTDWYDSRLTHVDPRDTWHKTSGRIYRIAPKNHQPGFTLSDLSSLSTDSLSSLLFHPNKWYRQQAVRLFGDRKDPSAIPLLAEIMKNSAGQPALDALWALYQSGGLDDKAKQIGLNHPNPSVRLWTFRLVCDDRNITEHAAKMLLSRAAWEEHPEVLSQMAASAKRLSAKHAFPIIRQLLSKKNILGDPDIPLMIWWAMENFAETDQSNLLGLFTDKKVFDTPLLAEFIAPRLAQRWIMSGTRDELEACATLLKQATGTQAEASLAVSILEGLRGNTQVVLSQEMQQRINQFQLTSGEAPLLLKLRKMEPEAIAEALQVIINSDQSLSDRLAYIELFGQITIPETVPALLEIAERDPSPTLKQAAIRSLESYNDAEIGKSIAKFYPSIRADSYVRESALHLFTVRKAWADAFFNELEQTRTIHGSDVPDILARKFLLLRDKSIDEKVNKHWPHAVPQSVDVLSRQINEASKTLVSGNAMEGKSVYRRQCAACHRFNQEGGMTGPDLTGYNLTDKNYFLMQVMAPNTDIREGYESFRIETNDGRVLEGQIIQETANVITLQPSYGGKPITVNYDLLNDREITAWSAMPEGLLDTLSEQERNNLFAYMTQQ